MSSGLLWSNLIAYSLQIGLLVGVAAVAPLVLRLRSPRAQLAYWHVLLAACLLLPLVRPWRQQAIVETVSVTTRVIAIAPSQSAEGRTIPRAEIALAVISFGVLARLGWLLVGFWKLSRYRRHSRPFAMRLPWPTRAELRIADEIASPVTFGARSPVVLLPAQFPALDTRAQDAILCHELLHVERRDWLFTVAEEMVRALFWFHPAIWWLLGEIQLAREQAVDREVIEMTQAREEYVDALLAIAGAKPQLDLALAPLFLRKRHLKQRVVSILKEVRMSKTKLISALAGSMCILLATCWFVTNTFPLAAAPQVVNDAAGVSVDLGGAALLHRAPVAYPEGARTKRIQGNVVVELTFDAVGGVADARVLSGPEELRRTALQSVLQWHFAHEAAGNKRQVTVAFQLPEGAQAAAAAPADGLTTPRKAGGAPLGRRPAPPATTGEGDKSFSRTLKSIHVVGLSDEARNELLSRLPVRAGATMTRETQFATLRAVDEFDEHLTAQMTPVADSEVMLTIVAPTPGMNQVQPRAAESSVPGAIRVGGNVQSTKLIQQPRPMYPPEAKAARIQGVVKLAAVIGKDGTVKNLEVISGHPLLVPSALDAVKNWVYQTTLLNGDPVEVQTQIDVNYTLSQ
jgi:TonB family protein